MMDWQTAARLFLQKDIEKCVVDANLAAVFDESEFSEAIHEKTHPRPGGADHLSQDLLADFRDHLVRPHGWQPRFRRNPSRS